MLQTYVANIIGTNKIPSKSVGQAFAPANIALAKYWGKRNALLNLPVTNSLSISLGVRGTYTKIELNDGATDKIYLNGKQVANNLAFAQKLINFLDLFRQQGLHFTVATDSNIPIGAGVASSASGFAALVKALDQLFAWNATEQQLSILARLGSGSASRSLWHGFVEWEAGTAADGLDSFAQPLPYLWPDLRIGLLLFSSQEKAISSREAMAATINTCPFYTLWPQLVAAAIGGLKAAIESHDFVKFASIAEANSLEMHALMLATKPTIIYSTAATIAAQLQIWQARSAGLQVFFTQDAGQNLKLLFLAKDETTVQQQFPTLEIVNPWESAAQNRP